MLGHMMSPPLHLSDIRCKYFPYRRCHNKQYNTRADELRRLYKINHGGRSPYWKIVETL